MSNHTEQLQGLINDLNKRRAEYVKEAKPTLAAFYREDRKRGRHPDEFKDTSFLYIRSYDGDIGIRPFSGIVFWHSPDISLTPLNGPQAYTTTLEAGKSYQLRCGLHNRGDIMIPYPKVEFFLTDPSIGFDTRYAQLIGLTQYNGLLLADSSGFVDFVYEVDPKASGHKCLFARTWSFSPPDRPVDLFALDPRIDRHIGQQNLNIVGQSQAFSFQLIHLPLSQDQLAMAPMTQQEVMMLRHPFLADFKIRGRVSPEKLRNMEIRVSHSAQDTNLTPGRASLTFISKGEGPSLQEQTSIYKGVEAAITSMQKGRGDLSQYREVLTAYRKMNQFMQRSMFEMRIPDFGLEKGEALAFKIVGTNTVNGQVKGGITVVVTGK